MEDDQSINGQAETERADAALLAQQARRRRARLRFNFAVIAALILTGWLASRLLLPDMPKPLLSAKPAPSHATLANVACDGAGLALNKGFGISGSNNRLASQPVKISAAITAKLNLKRARRRRACCAKRAASARSVSACPFIL